MDTKSKNTKKYPLIVKAVCLVLSVLCFAGTAVCGVYAVLAADFGVLTLSGRQPTSFYDTDRCKSLLFSDVIAISDMLLLPQRKQNAEALAAQKDEIVERELQQFLSRKAAIIRDEIYYVATHYDEPEDDYYYDAYMRDFSEPTAAAAEPTTAHAVEPSGEPSTAVTVTAPPEDAAAASHAVSESELSPLPTLAVDERAPYNVRYCQSLCNTVAGLDWLRYESLVREDAFDRSFVPQFGDLGTGESVTFNMEEPNVRLILENAYDNQLNRYRSEIESAESSGSLEGLSSLKYLAIAKDGTQYTNMTAAEKNGRNILSHSRCILCKDGRVTVQPENALLSSETAELVRSQFAPIEGTLYLYFDEQPVSDDRYTQAKAQFDTLFAHFSLIKLLLVTAVCVLGTLAFGIALLVLCGHKAGADGITLAFIDRLPTDVHLLLSGGCIAGIAVLSVIALYDLPYAYSSSRGPVTLWNGAALRIACACVLLTLAYLFGVEWLTSTVRIKKAGGSYFRRFVLWKLARFVFRGLRFCRRKVKAFFRFLLDKPKKLRCLPFVILAAMIVLSVPAALLAAAAEDLTPIALFVPLLTVLTLLGAVWFLRMLDRIAEAAETRTDLPENVTRRMPRALRSLAENLSVTNRELDRAVADAVRNERTKAELITNVSHDLKTPLTSVISYVDLLKKCDISDEKARGYIDVLDEKSAKLKRLVEDLIEASKVNTGNVTLQCVPLNLSELATQAVTEAAPDFEKQSLELKFTPPESAPVVFADGAKTYRILDNLLSNARKYSAPGSRVYAKVTEDDACGIFEIKNVSREPLDVDPQELMERFVRGDRSRTQDGNGLGLSIAQQLCLLQGGRLEIGIDGDLFKAAVYLPKQKPTEGSGPQA